MVASFSDAITLENNLNTSWDASVNIKTTKSAINKIRTSNELSQTNIKNLLPQYTTDFCQQPKSNNGVSEEKWYEELSNHMKDTIKKIPHKRKLLIQHKRTIKFESNLFFYMQIGMSTNKNCKEYSKQLLGIIDPIGSFIIKLNKVYVESIGKLLKLGFMQRIKYERKKKEYERSLTITFSTLCTDNL